MDADRFDLLTRSLPRAGNRRSVLSALAAAALGGIEVRRATAACNRRGDPCGNGQGGCCGDLKCCGGTCRNLQKDRKNCGECGEVCGRKSGRPTCVGGECTAKLTTGAVCPPESTSCAEDIVPYLCGNGCVCDIATDGRPFCGSQSSCFPANQCQEDADCFKDGIGNPANPPGTRCIHRTQEQQEVCSNCASHCVLPCGASVG